MQPETNRPKTTGLKLRIYPSAPPPFFCKLGRIPPCNTVTFSYTNIIINRTSSQRKNESPSRFYAQAFFIMANNNSFEIHFLCRFKRERKSAVISDTFQLLIDFVAVQCKAVFGIVRRPLAVMRRLFGTLRQFIEVRHQHFPYDLRKPSLMPPDASSVAATDASCIGSGINII